MPKDNEVDEKVMPDSVARATVKLLPFVTVEQVSRYRAESLRVEAERDSLAATVAELRAEVEMLQVQLACCGVEIELDPPAVDVAKAWQEGYRQGVLDERTSEDNIGIAGFGAKVEPARNNPYALAHQPGVSK